MRTEGLRRVRWIGVWAAMGVGGCGGDTDVDTVNIETESEVETETESETESETEVEVESETETPPPDPFAVRPMTLRLTTSYASDGSVWHVGAGGILYMDTPPSLYTEVDRDGDCRLLAGSNPFCADGCSDGLCTAPDVCTPWPVDASAGTLTIGHPQSAVPPITLPYAPGGYSWAADRSTFTAGAPVSVAAAGDTVPAFEGTVVQPEAIALTNYDSLDLDGAAPLTLTWTTPAVGALTTTRVRIRLQQDRAQHGRAYPGIIECDVADSGSFTIPERLRAAYANRDVFTCGKCPQSFLTRYEKTTVNAGGFVLDLIAESQASFLLTFIYPMH